MLECWMILRLSILYSSENNSSFTCGKPKKYNIIVFLRFFTCKPVERSTQQWILAHRILSATQECITALMCNFSTQIQSVLKKYNVLTNKKSESGLLFLLLFLFVSSIAQSMTECRLEGSVLGGKRTVASYGKQTTK